MLTTVALFFLGLTMVTKVKIWSSVTNIIITCRPKMAVSAEMPSVGACFPLTIFLSHNTTPFNVNYTLKIDDVKGKNAQHLTNVAGLLQL